MKLPNPVLIGRPQVGEPDVLGEWADHNITEDYVLGTRLTIEADSNSCEVCVNVAYIPGNPRKQQMIVILQPESAIPDELWEAEGFTKHQHKPKDNIEEYPF